MQVSIDSLTTDIVGHELLKADVVTSIKGLRLEPLPRNPERRDYLLRTSFRVTSGSRTVCHLTVGSGLDELWTRLRAFNSACPDITCRPLFLHRTDRLDYLGIEYIDGATIETLVLSGQMTPESANASMVKLMASLAGTFEASTEAAAFAELEELFGKICASSMFSGLDQRFLREFVFPFIRSGVQQQTPQTRWTNGDLIPRNVMIDRKGQTRLVDYELAHRTHFYGEDSWRWQRFSQLPPACRELPGSGHEVQQGPWLEAFCILHQLVLVHEINGAHLAVKHSPRSIERILTLTSEAYNGFVSSFFYQPFMGKPMPLLQVENKGVAQLFWSGTDVHTEEKSQRLELPFDQDAVLRFKCTMPAGKLHLRLDPIDVPGLIRISTLRVYVAQTEEVLLTFTSQTGWHGLELAGGSYKLADTPDLNLLSWNTDPILLLPSLELTLTSQDVMCEVGIRFTPKLDLLPALLPAPAAGLLHEDRDRIGQLEAELARINQESSKALTEAHEKERSNQAELTRLTTKTTDLEAAGENAARMAANLDQELRQIHEANRELLLAKEHATRMATRLEQDLQQAHEANRNLLLTQSDLTQRLQTTQTNAELAQAEHLAHRAMQTEQIGRLEHTLQDKASEITAFTQELANLRNELLAANQTTEGVRIDLLKVERDLSEYINQNSVLKTGLAKAHELLHEEGLRRMEIEKKANQSIEERDALHHSVEELRAKLASLTESLLAQNDTLRNQEEIAQLAAQEFHELKQNLKSAQNREAETTRLLAELQRQPLVRLSQVLQSITNVSSDNHPKPVI